jgi:hypothetical protein
VDVDIHDLIEVIQKNLTDDLLHPKYKKLADGGMGGHCYVASECFYMLYGKQNGYKPMIFKYPNGDTHWWLQKGQEKVDITSSQLPPDFDYSLGRSQFFVRYPSNRCKLLSRRVLHDLFSWRLALRDKGK